MMNEAAARGDDPLAGKVKEQTGIMRDQVTRHLERARIAARVAVVGTITDVVPVVQALARTIEKTHHDKDIAIDLDIQAPRRAFAASGRTWRRWSATSSTTPANGRARASRSR